MFDIVDGRWAMGIDGNNGFPFSPLPPLLLRHVMRQVQLSTLRLLFEKFSLLNSWICYD